MIQKRSEIIFNCMSSVLFYFAQHFNINFAKKRKEKFTDNNKKKYTREDYIKIFHEIAQPLK